MLDPKSEERRDELLTGDVRTLSFYSLYFPRLAVLSDSVKLETEERRAVKWSQKDEQSTLLLIIYLLSTFTVQGIVLSP